MPSEEKLFDFFLK